jgi:hypothetical protein
MKKEKKILSFDEDDEVLEFFNEKEIAWASFDYSISCPCLCLWKPQKFLNFKDCEFFFFIKEPSQKEIEAWRNLPKNMHPRYNFPKTKNQIETHINVAEYFISVLNSYNIMNLVLEGYSMGSHGRVFDIAEATMALKVFLYKKGIYENPTVFAPMTIKKKFSGKGNATKEMMFEELIRQNNLKTEKWIELAYNKNGKIKSPFSDICDSYAGMYSIYLNQKS